MGRRGRIVRTASQDTWLPAHVPSARDLLELTFPYENAKTLRRVRRPALQSGIIASSGATDAGRRPHDLRGDRDDQSPADPGECHPLVANSPLFSSPLPIVAHGHMTRNGCWALDVSVTDGTGDEDDLHAPR